jgi:uncharacterized phiE125 gp8 family phage protein
MRLTQTTAPDTTPVDLASAKVHCRVEHDDDDVFIQSMIGAAARHIERILGRAVMPQEWLLELTAWQDAVVLPIEPVRSVVVTYTDAAGDQQTLDAATYLLSAWPSMATEWRFASGALRPELDDEEYPVRFAIGAGYADADSVPEDLKVAVQMLVGHWYKHREAVVSGTISSELPIGVSALIAPYRRLV